MQRITHLFFDRYWITNDFGLRQAQGEFCFKVCPPAKPTEPFLVADRPWESMSLGWGTFLYDQGKYRLWYEAWDDQYKDDFDGRLCYAESEDSVNWHKPELGLVEYNGNTRNNIIFDGRMAGGNGFHGHSVFVDPLSQEARYRMLFMAGLRPRNDPQNYAMHPMSQAYSADGIHWHWGTPGQRSWLTPPFQAFGSDTQSVVYWDEERHKYVGYFRTIEPLAGRAIGRSETSDLSHWPVPKTILTPDEQDPFGSDLYNNAASRYQVPGDKAHFFFISVFDQDSDTLSAQLATSRNGEYYRRLDRTPFIGPRESFDCGGLYVCPGIQQIGNELVMTYHGVNYRHGEATPDQIRYAGDFVMLRFPRDRFQGLHTASRFNFTTPAFTNTGQPFNVSLNAIIQQGGHIRAGLLASGTDLSYLEGFSTKDCQPVTGDGTNLALHWKGNNRISTNQGEQLYLRIEMEQTILFSITYTAE